jgi:hypothetical protein
VNAPIDLRIGDLHARAAASGEALTVTLVGTADSQAETALGELLGRVHAESQRARAQEVAVDMRALEFMNSSCFKAFITWIVAVRRLPVDERYKITFLSSSALHWQKRSLHALHYFGGDLVRVEVE